MRAPRQAAGALERAVRVGYAAKGVLYLTIALFAGAAALGMRGAAAKDGKGAADSHAAMEAVVGAPFGRVMLGVIAAGLVAYGIWQIAVGLMDLENKGGEAKGIFKRGSFVVRGLFHLALAWSAVMVILGKFLQRGDNEERVSRATLDAPGGKWLLFGVAIGIAIYGGWQVYCAISAKLDKELDLSEVHGGARRAIVGISRFGIAARGVVFLGVALLFARAANHSNAKEAGGISDSIRELFGLGTVPALLIAFGLAAYGVYELVEARYRRIEIPR